MTERASGWYDDPQDPTLLRYWDGILWSDRTMPKVKPDLEQSHIGDARRQYEEQQERQRQSELQRQGYSQHPEQQPLRPYQAGQQNPYSYQQAPTRPVKIAPDGEPTASWWRRFFAYVIDYFLLTAVALAVSWPWLQSWFGVVSSYWDDVMKAAQNGQSQPPTPSALYDVPWQFPVALLLIYLVYEIGMVAWRGQTLGHLVCGVRVRGAASSGKPTIEAAAIRAAVKGISFVPGIVPVLGSLGTIFGLVDGLVPLGDRGAQSFHDRAAKTFVVSARNHDGRVPGGG